MKSNKFMVWLILFSIVTIVSACSSDKKNKYNQSSHIITKNNNKNVSNVHHFLDEQVRLHMQNNNTIYFDTNKYDVKPDYFQMLEQHVTFLHAHPSYKVTIEGHTDERGTPEYNIALGERRANAIKIYLESKGILSEQIFIVSYGKEKPIVLGHNEMAYTKNRRAILIY
ncbi:peptidoglycan-associated lipoprotein Pal [Pantoea sp. Aalb]|uniref:peptidoglycan-associated lipoprotein Pal n=1 Tax=Pantoea sp. Aalb TaxID=2576762 RepID=UPI001323D694|nr:peptidoglycan-associated lipoprotein Pal [Pantoea sp. Aalb]MXP67526.1 peptidoglycan-associated lipoprotein Pal [Pantoea sp. Aalb]